MTERTKEQILEQINRVVNEYVQPAVQQHGGYIKVEDFDNISDCTET